MQKLLLRSILLVFITFLVVVLTIPAHAQIPILTPTPTVVQFANQDVVTFAQLQDNNMNEIVLNGPYESDGIGFTLPANWELKAGTQLDLLFGVSFNTDVGGQSDVIIVGGGTLSILFNDVLLSTLQLNELGEIEAQIVIPLEAIDAVGSNDVHILSFLLESSETCRFYGQNTTVYIHPTSFLTLPHEIIRPSTSLINFPRPIFQNSFLPDSALVIVPDQPSPAELQAALTTAAGLGKLSSNELILDMTTISNFKNEDARNNHIIFVGKAVSLPVLEGLNLPLPAVNGQFQLPGEDPDDGLIEMIISPWSNSHVALVISSNTDQGIIKAAQAVSNGVIRSNLSDDFAVIEQVNLTSKSNLQAVNRTLADLGYEGRTFDNRGFNAAYYDFNIPVGMSVSPESYFEMVYGHSALVDYDSSQIVIILNNQPIGSIRMSDATADQPTNKVKVMIPPSIIRPGINYLVVQVYLVPLDECVPPDIQGLWVNIWPESTLHLPHIVAPVSPFSLQELADFPDPFTYSPFLENTAFVLERNDLESWRNALQIAAYLGWQSRGSVAAFSAFYGDEFPEPERSIYNLLIFGRPSQMNIMSEINDSLPVPFAIGSDIASEGNNFQVTYRIPPDSPMGYLEIIQSPWNPANVLLAVLGNTTQGVNWATSALMDNSVRWRLASNFAEVNGPQVFVADKISPYVAVSNNSTPEPNSGFTPTDLVLPPSPARQQEWVAPVFILTIVLIILIIMFVIMRYWLSNRTRHKRENDA